MDSVITFAVSLVTVCSACIVAFSRNIVHSAFALLGVFAGVMGLYIILSADFVAVIQLVIYIGGVLVLILFAVLLTTKIGDVKISNKAMTPSAAAIFILLLGAIIYRAFDFFKNITPAGNEATTKAIGQKLLTDYLLPFEIVSLLLVLVLVGAAVIGRREI